MKTQIIIPIVILLTGIVVSSRADTLYTVTNLGGRSTWAMDINESGQVTGQTFYDNKSYPFLWDESTGLQRLPTLGGIYSEGTAINNKVQVVGGSRPADETFQHAFIWDAVNGIRDIGTLGYISSCALDINDSGIVVGYVKWWTGANTAFIYDDSNGMRKLSDFIPANSDWTKLIEAYDINNAGEIVGVGEIDESIDSFYYSSEGNLVNLSELWGGDQVVTRINNNGQILGHCWVPFTDGQGFIYDIVTGEITNIGTLNLLGSSSYSIETDINDLGQVVGFSDYSAFLFEDGEIFDLNELLINGDGWHLDRAYGINNLGQIVGIGDYDGKLSAYILTPIPEPATVMLFGLGVFSLRRRRR